MHNINSQHTLKSAATLNNNKINNTHRSNYNFLGSSTHNRNERRRSSVDTKKSYNQSSSRHKKSQHIPIPNNQNMFNLIQDPVLVPAHFSPEEEKGESIFDIVYSATTEMITPPPSPKSTPQIPMISQSFEANDRILTVKRQGQLKLLMTEYAALKKEGLLFTSHTYNLIFETYSSLRRDGTPLTPMIKIYDEMLRSNIPPSSSTYTILIRTLCKRDVEVQKVIAMLKRQNARASDQQHKNNNMTELESEENIEKALVMFSAAVSENLVQFFEAELYNQILRVLSHYGNTEKSLYVYRQLELHSTPTSATFAALINLFGRVGDLASALFYFNRYNQLKDSIGPHDASYIYNAVVDAHLKCKKLEGALKVIEQDMKSSCVKITTIPYNSVIRYYCTENRLDEAKEFIQSMKNSLPQPDASSYGPLLSSYCQLGLFKEATEIYQALIQTDISKSYGNLAKYALLCLEGVENNHKVIEVMQDMHRAGLEPDCNLAERVVTKFAKLGLVSDAILALRTTLEIMNPRSVSKGSLQIKNAAIKAASASKGNFSQTLEIARLMTSHCSTGLSYELAYILLEDYEFDSNHDIITPSDYTILFDASITVASEKTRGKPSLSSFNIFVFCLYNEMATKNYKVDTNVRYRVSSYFTRIGDKMRLQMWEGLFNNNKEETTTVEMVASVPSEAEEASAAVMKTAIHGQLEESLDILKSQIIDANLIPTPEPIRDAIAFIGKQGHLEFALKIYHLSIKCFKESTLDSQRIERAVYMMTNSILIGYAQQGDMINAKHYYELIKSMGRYPDGNGYASLLLGSAKCATDEATDALTIYDEAKRRDVKPTTFFYNVVISKLAKARKLDAAMKLFEEMKNFKIMPNSITYGAIISACVRAGSEPLSRKLFSEMLTSPSFKARVGPFNNMIQFYVRQQPDRERALNYFSEMRRRQIKPSAHTYKLLMEAYALISPYDMSTAYSMLDDMKRLDHICPEATHYATLIYSYGTLQQDVQSAEKIFKEMEKKQIEMDEVVFQALIDTFISNDRLTEAESLYSKMQGVIQKSTSPYIENVFIRGYGQKGMLEKAKQMFDAMMDDKINHEDSFATIREPSTYEAMVRAYIENNKINEAKEILKLMVQREFPEKVTASVAELITA